MSSEHKADTNHAIVGMASILAKVRRDEIIEALKSRDRRTDWIRLPI
jgi:ribonuclease HII